MVPDAVHRLSTAQLCYSFARDQWAMSFASCQYDFLLLFQVSPPNFKGNLLSLRDDIHINPTDSLVSTSQLNELIGDYLIRSIDQNLVDEVQLEHLLNLIPSLSQGLNINIQFNS